MILKHFGFVRCKIDTICFKASLLGVVEDFAIQIPYEESDIVDEAYVQASAKAMVSAIDDISTLE